MSRASSAPSQGHKARQDIPPRDRILAAARELFYRRGLRAVSVDEVAAAADTNKMTLYRHFESKDRLIAEYLRQLANEAEAAWAELTRAHPDQPRTQLEAWLKDVCKGLSDPANRGCALANAGVEIPEKEHPAREVIENHKERQREHIATLCRNAGFRDPEKLADELFLLLEGARVNMQSVGHDGPCCRTGELLRTLIDAHALKPRA